MVKAFAAYVNWNYLVFGLKPSCFTNVSITNIWKYLDQIKLGENTVKDRSTHFSHNYNGFVKCQ